MASLDRNQLWQVCGPAWPVWLHGRLPAACRPTSPAACRLAAAAPSLPLCTAPARCIASGTVVCLLPSRVTRVGHPSCLLPLCGQWFAKIDANSSGTLDVMELQRALALGGLNFSLKTVQAMMRLHDRSGDGQVGGLVGSDGGDSGAAGRRGGGGRAGTNRQPPRARLSPSCVAAPCSLRADQL